MFCVDLQMLLPQPLTRAPSAIVVRASKKGHAFGWVLFVCYVNLTD